MSALVRLHQVLEHPHPLRQRHAVRHGVQKLPRPRAQRLGLRQRAGGLGLTRAGYKKAAEVRRVADVGVGARRPGCFQFLVWHRSAMPAARVVVGRGVVVYLFGGVGVSLFLVLGGGGVR